MSIVPHSTNQINGFWRRGCRCRRTWLSSLKTLRRRRHWQRGKKTMIWLVQWGKIIVLHVRHRMTEKTAAMISALFTCAARALFCKLTKLEVLWRLLAHDAKMLLLSQNSSTVHASLMRRQLSFYVLNDSFMWQVIRVCILGWIPRWCRCAGSLVIPRHQIFRDKRNPYRCTRVGIFRSTS